MSDNLLYYGDNLYVLCRHVKDDPGAPGLVYLDPPFKSNQDYPGAPGLFAERDGTQAAAQIKAFEDPGAPGAVGSRRTGTEGVSRGGRGGRPRLAGAASLPHLPGQESRRAGTRLPREHGPATERRMT